MKLTFHAGIFVAINSYDERNALKTAGFSFHPGLEACKAGPATCLACRKGFRRGWWTRRPEAAVRLVAYSDEKAKQALLPHMRKVEMSRAVSADAEIPHPPGLDYFPFQKAGILYMAEREATLLGDEQGLGKTPQALGVINIDPGIRSVLVVCPASLRVNWHREAKRWLVKDGRDWRFHLVDEDEPLPPDANFIIANYNRVTIGFSKCTGPCDGERRKDLPCPTCNGTGNGLKAPDLCATCAGRKTTFCPICKGRGKFATQNLKVVESITSREWDLFVADECHFLKNPKAQRTRAVIGIPQKSKPGLVDTSKKTLFLTGTPMPNRPIEMWPVLSVCAPKEFGNMRLFAKRYCAAHDEYISKTKKRWRTDGASNLEELQEKLRSTCLLRRLKRDVLKDLPPKIRQVIPLVPTEKAKKLIAEELEIWDQKFGHELELVQEVISVTQEQKGEAGKESDEYKGAVDRLKYIQRVAFMEMAKVRHDVAVAKIPSVIEHLKGMFKEGCSKIICFAHHHDVIKALIDQFQHIAVSLYGDTKGGVSGNNERQQAVDRFQTDPRVKLFIGGIMAAGTGLTLTAASTVVFAELDWTPSNITQAEDRAHRIGQVNSVLVQHLVLDGSLDARMAQMLVEKQEIADRALDSGTNVAIKHLLDARPEVPTEPVAMWMKIILAEAMITLAQRRDPGVEGSHGFSQFDAEIGQKLATWKGTYSDKQAHLALKFTKKYRRQLDDHVQKQLGVYEPPTPAELHRLRKQAMRNMPKTPPPPPPSLFDEIEKKALA